MMPNLDTSDCPWDWACISKNCSQRFVGYFTHGCSVHRHIIHGLLPTTAHSNFMGMVFGMILLLLHWRMKRQDGELGLQDERSLRIGTYGIACSWYLTYIVVILLATAISLGGMQVPAESVVLILIILMPISTILFQTYFNHKGDISWRTVYRIKFRMRRDCS